jgi:Zn-dependent protease
VSPSASADDPPIAAPGGIRIGRVGSVPIHLRASWFAIAAAVTFLYAPTVRNSVLVQPGLEYLIAFGFAMLLLLSVFVHELAHAAAASATGTPAAHIVLDLWGGHTSFSAESSGPWRSVGVSVVGPLSNAAIAAAAALAVAKGGTDPDGVPRLLLNATAAANLLVAGFNALPGLPLDGGRILEALVWRVSGDRITGTLVAGWTGRALAVGTVGWGLVGVVSGQRTPIAAIWLLAVAAPLWLGAGQAIAAGHWYRQAERAQTSGLMQRAVAVPSTATVATALLAAAEAGASAVVVLDVYGRPASVVDERAAAGVPAARADLVAAAAVAEALPEGAVIEVGLSGDELISRLQARPAARYAVLDLDEQVSGVLDWEDVAAFVTRR